MTAQRPADPAVLHGAARAALMTLVVSDPRTVAAFTAITGPTGDPLPAADDVLADLLRSLAPLAPWPWFETELGNAARAWTSACRQHRRNPPVDGWYRGRRAGILAESGLAAPLTAPPTLPKPPEFWSGCTADEAHSALDRWYFEAQQAIQAVTPREPPARRASPVSIDAAERGAGWLYRHRFLGESITSIAATMWGNNANESGLPGDRTSWVRSAIARVSDQLATEPGSRLLGSADRSDRGERKRRQDGSDTLPAPPSVHASGSPS